MDKGKFTREYFSKHVVGDKVWVCKLGEPDFVESMVEEVLTKGGIVVAYVVKGYSNAFPFVFDTKEDIREWRRMLN